MNDDIDMDDDDLDDGGDPIYALAQRLIDLASEAEVMVATAESCTGGMIAAAITDVAGSSSALDRGFVTYSNAAKAEMLGVPEADIAKHGAVSEEVAAAMAEGALARSDADIAVSVTGIAGPGGASDIKPVGLVWFACASAWAPTLALSVRFDDNGRAYIRHYAALTALEILLDTLENRPPSNREPVSGTA